MYVVFRSGMESALFLLLSLASGCKYYGMVWYGMVGKTSHFLFGPWGGVSRNLYFAVCIHMHYFLRLARIERPGLTFYEVKTLSKSYYGAILREASILNLPIYTSSL
jgi:hypothetical protein